MFNYLPQHQSCKGTVPNMFIISGNFGSSTTVIDSSLLGSSPTAAFNREVMARGYASQRQQPQQRVVMLDVAPRHFVEVGPRFVEVGARVVETTVHVVHVVHPQPGDGVRALAADLHRDAMARGYVTQPTPNSTTAGQLQQALSVYRDIEVSVHGGEVTIRRAGVYICM
jgi:hypothetical protein